MFTNLIPLSLKATMGFDGCGNIASIFRDVRPAITTGCQVVYGVKGRDGANESIIEFQLSIAESEYVLLNVLNLFNRLTGAVRKSGVTLISYLEG